MSKSISVAAGTLPVDGQVALPQVKLARALGVSDRTIRNWDRAGLLVGRRVNGGVKLYAIEDARRLLSAGR